MIKILYSTLTEISNELHTTPQTLKKNFSEMIVENNRYTMISYENIKTICLKTKKDYSFFQKNQNAFDSIYMNMKYIIPKTIGLQYLTIYENGDIVNFKGEKIGDYVNSEGYYEFSQNSYVYKLKNMRLVHQFICSELFDDYDRKKHIIDHIDKNRLNNSFANLRLGTYSLNNFNNSENKHYGNVYKIKIIKTNEIYVLDNIRGFAKAINIGSSPIYRIINGEVKKSRTIEILQLTEDEKVKYKDNVNFYERII